ncbi:MAG: hypothetical protein C5B59_13555 [Bacteroidetes bacterium]|nr:MAG: hypothetical protein C5B59_13555 [Bacteroidota bacterium]
MKKVLLLGLSSCLLFSCSNQSSTEKAEVKDSVAAAPAKPQPAEFADAKYAELGKKGLAALSSGDIDSWMNSFADNAVYIWNNGDSVAGKQAITAYWKKRRGQVIDSITFVNEIWLPIKVNQPQSVEAPGIWLLSWYAVTAKYKTGKKMSQWIHTDTHYDANDKIDRVIQYLDRAPINAATMTK